MRTLGNAQTVAVIGAALDLGAGRRGVDMGPSAIRYAGLDARIEGLGLRCEDWGNVTTAVADLQPLSGRAARSPTARSSASISSIAVE